MRKLNDSNGWEDFIGAAKRSNIRPDASISGSAVSACWHWQSRAPAAASHRHQRGSTLTSRPPHRNWLATGRASCLYWRGDAALRCRIVGRISGRRRSSHDVVVTSSSRRFFYRHDEEVRPTNTSRCSSVLRSRRRKSIILPVRRRCRLATARRGSCCFSRCSCRRCVWSESSAIRSASSSWLDSACAAARNFRSARSMSVSSGWPCPIWPCVC